MSEVSFRPFRMRDLDSIEVQPRHEETLKTVRLRPFTLLGAEDSLWSFTMWVDRKPLACVGATEDGELWAFLAADLRRHMIPLTRYGKSMIDAHKAIVGPVWADIDRDHPEAVRWIRLAGFREIKPFLWVYP